MQNRERLLMTLAGVYTYYERELSEYIVSVWVEDLDGYEIADIERAFARHRRDPERGQWLPKVADILRQLHGDAGQNAAIAWGKVIECARAGGAGYEDLPAESKAALDSIGGLSMLRRADERQTAYLQRQFVAAHRAHVFRSPFTAVEHEAGWLLQ